MGLSLADIGAPALALFDLARCVFRLPLSRSFRRPQNIRG